MFAKRLRELRNSANILQSELAKRLNVSQQTIASWESGRSAPNFELLTNIAHIFGVSIDYLLGNDLPNGAHDLLEELFADNPKVLNAVKNISIDGKMKDENGSLIFSDTHKAFIKQSILLALKEAKAEQTNIKSIEIKATTDEQ